MWTWAVSLLFAASISTSGLLAEEAKSPSAPDSESSHSQLVHSGADGKLAYKPDAKGNTIPDFSNCGYMGGGVALPNVPVRVTLKPEPGTTDDTARVQAAIEAVSKMPTNTAGFRGAVLLKQGQYRIGGALRIAASGVVLRGEGQVENGTVLVATGTKRRTLIAVQGSSGPKANSGSRQSITSEYVPVGARTFEVRDGLKFKVGDTVIVSRNGNEAWIHEIGMDRIAPRPGNPSSTRQWAPFSLPFDRVITSVAGNRLTVDAPIVCAIETRWGGGDIWRYDDEGRIEQSGVENLRGVSDFDRTVTEQQRDQKYFADEAHATQLVSFDNARNCWARDLTALHFYHGVSAIERNAKWVTVQDCSSLDPVPEGRWLWVSRDAPLMTFDRPQPLARLTNPPPRTGRLLAMIYNNFWYTNFLGDQPGVMEFQFDLVWQPTASGDAAALAESLTTEPVTVINPALPEQPSLLKHLYQP
jgi:hypothetical protein